MFRACWGVFSLVTSFYGYDGAKFADKFLAEYRITSFSHRDLAVLLALWFSLCAVYLLLTTVQWLLPF
jgi:hypothetical protein